jgi:hypothetical protein
LDRLPWQGRRSHRCDALVAADKKTLDHPSCHLVILSVPAPPTRMPEGIDLKGQRYQAPKSISGACRIGQIIQLEIA